MDFLEAILSKAKAKQKRLVLTEGKEAEAIKAARVILNEGLASSVTLLGKKSDIQKIASEEGVDLSDLYIIEPEFSNELNRYANEYLLLRNDITIKMNQAKQDMMLPLYYGAMMVHLGDADAVVGGAESSAMDVLNAGLLIIGTADKVKTPSSCSILLSSDSSWGYDGAFIFSDCSIIAKPSAEELSDIAISASISCRDYFGVKPVLALLSHSTKGSKKPDKDIEKIQNALKMIKERESDLNIDGEMQFDAALIPSVTDYLAPGSPVKGKVNTLIFPNMEAGNIGFQIARAFGKAETYGPFLQGFAKPISYIPHGSLANKVVVCCAAALARA